MLNLENRSKKMSAETIVEKFVQNFEEMNETLMSSNPCSFPTFRPSIESALKSGVKPYGLITGIRRLRYRKWLLQGRTSFVKRCFSSRQHRQFRLCAFSAIC